MINNKIKKFNELVQENTFTYEEVVSLISKSISDTYHNVIDDCNNNIQTKCRCSKKVEKDEEIEAELIERWIDENL